MKVCWLWLLSVASHLFLKDLCFAYRLPPVSDRLYEGTTRLNGYTGELNAEGCLDVTFTSRKPPSEYSIVVSQADTTRSLFFTRTPACGIDAAVTGGYADEESGCASRILDLETGAAGQLDRRPFRQHLRLSSSCGNVTAKYQVVEALKAASRRRLAAIAPAPATSTAVAAPVGAPTLAILNPGLPVPQNESMPPALYAPGPSVNVACCCGPNNGYSGNSQSCCCGPISICCQATGFCVSQNCTAIFVGSTLIAGALISFMTCGICIYRARVSLHEPVHFWARGQRNGLEAGEGRQRPWRPVPVHAPPDAEEGTQRDCPVCLEEVTKNAEWVNFPCRHGTCRNCYGQLVGKPDGDAACPLCRTALTEPLPDEEAAPQEVALQLQPMSREPAQALEGSTSQLPAPPVVASSLGPHR